ncbi:hypothetical protein ACE1TF_05825 [Geomicrobium sp. JSM 1781026]|uniref:hypothetical protein n=1 Tax=Geomicrobium sp. JSM 1781026 TaxID=3344580 RepID=UPI0035BF197C
MEGSNWKEVIGSKLTEDQRRGIRKHERYLHEYYRLNVELMNITKQSLKYRKLVEDPSNERLGASFIQDLEGHFTNRTFQVEQLQVNLIENRDGRKCIKEILADSMLTEVISLSKEIKLIVGEINGSEEAINRTIERTPQYQSYNNEEWLSYKKNPENEKEYISDFADTMVKKNCVLSPNCIFLKKQK